MTFFLERKGSIHIYHSKRIRSENIEKKWFCFQQILGRNVAIEGDIKRFVLNVFHSDAGLQAYNYSYKKWQPLLIQHHLPVIVGRDQFGNMITYDMIASNTPHLLIAGETGSGKVVWYALYCPHSFNICLLINYICTWVI